MAAHSHKKPADAAKDSFVAKKRMANDDYAGHGTVKNVYRQETRRATAADSHCEMTRFGARNGLFRTPKQAVLQSKIARLANKLKTNDLRHALKCGGRTVGTAKYLYKIARFRSKAGKRREQCEPYAGNIAGIRHIIARMRSPHSNPRAALYRVAAGYRRWASHPAHSSRLNKRKAHLQGSPSHHFPTPVRKEWPCYVPC